MLKVLFGVTLAYSAVLTDLVSSAGPEQLKKNPEILQVAAKRNLIYFIGPPTGKNPYQIIYSWGPCIAHTKDFQRISLGPIEVNVATHYDRILN